MKNVKDFGKITVAVAKEIVSTTLVYAGVGMAVMKAVKEISKAKDYFDKK